MPNAPLCGIGLPPSYGLRHTAPLLDCLVIGAIPALRHWSQPALFADGLETQPAVSELRGDRRARDTDWFVVGASIISAATLERITSLFVFHSPMHKATLGRRRMDLPDVPDPALFVLEGSVSHSSRE